MADAEPKDPISQAMDAMAGLEADLVAEQLKAHAEMVLLTALTEKPNIQGNLLFMASQEGPEYLSGLLVAAGLTARNWGRTLSGDSTIDFTRYAEPEAEVFCEVPGDGFAHYLAVEILKVAEVEQADHLREEMIAFHGKHSLEDWGRMTIHVIRLFADLVGAVLDVCNGDYIPEEDGHDRRPGA